MGHSSTLIKVGLRSAKEQARRLSFTLQMEGVFGKQDEKNSPSNTIEDHQGARRESESVLGRHLGLLMP